MSTSSPSPSGFSEFNARELMAHYEANDLKLKKFVPIIKDAVVYPVIRDANGVVLSLPPIINGSHSAISLDTKNGAPGPDLGPPAVTMSRTSRTEVLPAAAVFIECTAVDLHKANVVLNTVCTMFAEYCERPFEVEPVEVIDAFGDTHVFPRMEPRSMDVTVDQINRAVGVKLQPHKASESIGPWDDPVCAPRPWLRGTPLEGACLPADTPLLAVPTFSASDPAPALASRRLRTCCTGCSTRREWLGTTTGRLSGSRSRRLGQTSCTRSTSMRTSPSPTGACVRVLERRPRPCMAGGSDARIVALSRLPCPVLQVQQHREADAAHGHDRPGASAEPADRAAAAGVRHGRLHRGAHMGPRLPRREL